jgi:hypothetical protein
MYIRNSMYPKMLGPHGTEPHLGLDLGFRAEALGFRSMYPNTLGPHGTEPHQIFRV